jgi:hypothetical protein
MPELLIGCGADRVKRIGIEGNNEWTELVTLDFNADHNPDVVHDLNKVPYPFEDNAFDEIHGYEILEHLGTQGDFRTFFDQFSEFWRLLKPNGLLIGTSPHWTSKWIWGDPGHTRVISLEVLTFLSQACYTEQIGKTTMTDYRFIYKADFDLIHSSETGPPDNRNYRYVLRAIKPSRISI